MSETRNIDDMQPGRELDAMVSEALGDPWPMDELVFAGGPEAPYSNLCVAHAGVANSPFVGRELSYYSTENSVAIGLAETLPSFNVFVNYPIPASGNIHTNAGAMCDDMGCDETCANATTIAHAICLTFLKAVADTAHKP